jgi:thiamine-phosphate pyrophosphorylase
LLITDRGQTPRPLVAVCDAVLDAGFHAVMLREKDLEGRELLTLARPLAEACRARGAAFLVNDRLDVALSIPGAGAHVGLRGIPVAAARQLLGPRRLLGYSAHEPVEARAALDAGADYVTLSPVFPSRSKPELAPRGRAWLADAARILPPEQVLALGGMTPEHAGEAGALGLGAAVMGDLMRAADPALRAREYATAWTAARLDPS